MGVKIDDRPSSSPSEDHHRSQFSNDISPTTSLRPPFAKRTFSLQKSLSNPHHSDAFPHNFDCESIALSPNNFERNSAEFDKQSARPSPLRSGHLIYTEPHYKSALNHTLTTHDDSRPSPVSSPGSSSDSSSDSSSFSQCPEHPSTPPPALANSRTRSLPEQYTVSSFRPPANDIQSSSTSVPVPQRSSFSSLPGLASSFLDDYARKRTNSPVGLTTSLPGHLNPFRSNQLNQPTAIRSPAQVSRSSSTSSFSFPAPEPPVILPSASQDSNRESVHSREACDTFLSHAPPPVDSWIEVETSGSEYKLIVRLPGFNRDGITLATRRKRVLHVVADSWDPCTGGHFERRISFGYDADLTQVKAEFDGELLKVIIPRRSFGFACS